MNRRSFLRANGALCAGFALTKAAPVLAERRAPDNWRTFEVVTQVELLKPSGIGHIWLPAALTHDTPYQKSLSNRFTAQSGTVRLTRDKENALGIVSATFPADTKPALTLTSRVALRNYTVDLTSRGSAKPVPRAEQDYFLQPSRYVPTDGIVKETALKATADAVTDTEKAQAMTGW